MYPFAQVKTDRFLFYDQFLLYEQLILYLEQNKLFYNRPAESDTALYEKVFEIFGVLDYWQEIEFF